MRTAPLLGLAALALPASAQFDDGWLEYAPDATLLPAGISDPSNETDLAWGDLDQDGAEDLVVVRVQPIMAGGDRANLLLMNEGGVLVDRTALYAGASDVVGDQGFQTPTADRDVVVVDVDGDGWLDVVTAVGFGSVSEPKHISHPRVYRNLGNDPTGAWLGLRHEDARIPTLINFVSGLAVSARFNGVAAGDVDGDGDADLYFVDHDASPANPFGGEPANFDTDDRLFLNDGNGFFTDATMATLTPGIIDSNFANSAAIADFDGDGAADIAKQTNGVPGGAAATVAYNAGAGTFATQQTVYTGSAYSISTGDLNGDGRTDLVVSENGLDGVVYNLSTSGGQVVWSPLVPFEFLSGGDDSFAANSLATDLDGDGLEDVLIADVDPQIAGFNRRLHIYHNRGNAPLGNAILREERQTAGAGWVGAVGLDPLALRGTHDIAVLDINLDGLDDLVVSRNASTEAYVRVPACQTDLGGGTPGLVLEVCGNKLATGNEATATLTGALPGVPVLVLLATAATPTFIPQINDTVLAFPPIWIGSFNTNASGELALPVPGGGGPATLVVQMLAFDGTPDLFSPSNAVEVEFLP